MDTSLTSFFRPRGVVIFGASTNPAKLGYGAARNLVNSGYNGAIHFVSHKSGNLFGRPIYTGLEQVPDPVDLALLIVPAPGVADALHACDQRGIKAAIIVSSGFREAGVEGAGMEAEILHIAREHGIRLIGPNCIGLLDTHLPLDTTFLPPPMPKQGDVAFISQSGAICAAIIDWARGQGFGFSRLISLGNQADINETDMLAAVVEDEHTRVLTLYIESVSNGARFIAEAGRVAARKPILALKVGRSAAGKRAATSHTGALAGQDAAYDAAFRKAGVFRAATSEEMFDWASALACCPLPKGRQMAVLTNAGGPGVIAADALEMHGLSLAEIAPSTRAAIAALLPPAAGLHNPIDMLASASPQQYADCLRLLLDDANVDGAMIILPHPPMFPAEAVADSLIPLIQNSPKPVVIALMGEHLIQAAAIHFRRARVPEYRFPERAASALTVLAERAEFLSKQTSEVSQTPGISKEAARSILADFITKGFLEPEAVDRLMAAYGIPTAPVRLARTEAEAAQIASDLGFPVVVKVASPDIPHKSDVGGVLLDIANAASTVKAFCTVTERARQAKPDARIEGVQIQRQLPEGQEVIVGASRDAQFGALVMFGSGGVEVEGLKDVAFALAPLTDAEAEDLLRRTWAGRKLAGFRSITPVDGKAVKNVLIRLAKLAHEFPEINEIEINPLRVLARGAVAVDVRIK